jgi:type I restriction enzyme S subunit
VIESLKPYPSYKDSGVDWLGSVPESWSVGRQASVVELRVSNVDKHVVDGEIPVRLCNYVDVYKNDRIHLGMDFSKGTARPSEVERFRLEPGDVVITKDSESWDDIASPALIEEGSSDLVCGYHLAILRPGPDLSGPYLLRATQSVAVAGQYQVAANGVTRFGLTHGGIRGIHIPLPPSDDQAAIVRYLDHIDSRVQRFIAAKERMIELLEEEKQGIIHRAVTRGLDAAVPLKPSGIDWLGDIPEHWDLRRNGRLFRLRRAKGDPSLPVLEVSLRTGVRERGMNADGRKQMTGDLADYQRAHVGDIAYNMMRMWQGAVGVVPTEGLISPAYVVASPKKGVHSFYYGRLFRIGGYMGQVERHSRGIVKDRLRLYWEDFKALPSPYPPSDEQAAIGAWLDVQEDAIKQAVSSARQEIALIGAYRTRLISDLVTGKLDVRETARELPDVSDADAAGIDDRLERALA